MKAQFDVWLKRVVLVALVALFAGVVRADSLELKNGQVIQGRFLGGSEFNIRFQVEGGEQIFATNDVLNIGFSDTTTDNTHSSGSFLPNATPATDATKASSSTPERNSQLAQDITIPSGTSIIVRMIDTVDSSVNEVGDTFHASLESPLLVHDTVVAPKGADVFGKLAQAKQAGKISGGAELTLELTGIRINGKIVPVDSTDYDVSGQGRGKESAERIGGGAVLGAIIGGIAGGGKGAAIGAGAGAGAGTGVQLLTHGDKIRIPSETLLEFKLQNDVMARISTPSAAK